MDETTSPPPGPEADNVIRCSASESFSAWLSQMGGSLAVTTYQAGKVALIGWNGRQVTVLLRHFARPMGLAVAGGRLALAVLREIWLFSNVPALAATYPLPTLPRIGGGQGGGTDDAVGGYDSLYLPRTCYFTGGLNIHDLAFGRDGLWLVNTRFSCLAGLSEEHSFVPRWQPRFITALMPEDRCHLNGVAMIEGRPRFVTALGETDSPLGWRPTKATGGILIDVETNEIVLRGLSMPHSPRWHDGKLWFLNSGTGELCVADVQRSQSTVVCALPGFLRGLCFVGPYGLVGLCQMREKRTFGNLPIEQRFPKLLCGVAVVDLRAGQQIAFLEFTSSCQELYDVQFLPGVYRPMILNRDQEATGRAFTAPEFCCWVQPEPVPNPMA